ncbi:MAG: NAD(P)H-binding protein [Cyanobacteria bacterium SZAS-4]|nr:NAD(P)H-binding protein [Cyanobacteria bacterium SZAS-4]
MIVAITGGTGFLGAHLARTLVANGHYAKVLARGINNRDPEIRKTPNAAFTPVQYGDEKNLYAAFMGCDTLAHMVGINREAQRGDFQRVHVETTKTVIHAALRARVKKIIYVSYLRARPRAFSSYYKSKWEAEELIRNSGLDYTILKPGIIYGTGDSMLTSIKRTLDMLPGVAIFPSVGLMEKKMSPIAVEDMVHILIAAAVDDRLSRQTVAVVGPEEITLSKAVKRVSKVMKKPTLILPVPTLAHYMIAAASEKSMRNPLTAFAQIRMLSEGMSQPLSDSEMLPSDLVPHREFNEETIRAGLHEPGQ